MDLKTYPVIDPVATGNNIRRLRMERGALRLNRNNKKASYA